MRGLCLFIAGSLLALNSLHAADRYWVAASTSNWNNTANWSASIGGAGGASVPGTADNAYFDSNGLGNCTVDLNVTIAGIHVHSGYLSDIDLNGFSFQINGSDAIFRTGSISDVSGTSTLVINTPGYSEFRGTQFNLPVTCSSGRIRLDGSFFGSTTSFTKTGATNDFGFGGNTFTGDCFISHTGTDSLYLGNLNGDTWNGNVTVVNNSNAGGITLAHVSSGNTIAGTLDVTSTGSSYAVIIGSSPGSGMTVSGAANFTLATTVNSNMSLNSRGTVVYQDDVTINSNPNSTIPGHSLIYVSQFITSQTQIDGHLEVNMVGGDSSRVQVGSDGDVDLNSSVTVNNTGTGIYSEVLIGANGDSYVTIDGTVDVIQSGGGTYRRTYLGSNGDVVFNGDITLTNNASAIEDNNIHLHANPNCTNVYNANIVVSNTGMGIFFGGAGGSGTMNPGYTLTVATGGFDTGRLNIRRFTQLGTTPQNLVMGNNTILWMIDCEWNGPLDILCPYGIYRTNTFNNDFDWVKYGNTYSAWGTTGNTFNGTTTITNSGTNWIGFSFQSGLPEDFNGDVTFITTSTGRINVCQSDNLNTHAGDININSSNEVLFGAGSGGGVTMDGTLNQAWNDLTTGATPTPTIGRFRINKAGGEVNMNMPAFVNSELDLDQGIVNTDNTNILSMLDDAVVASVSNASYIEGPIVKIGDDAFDFPVGGAGFYRPASITAPATATASFRSEYRPVDAHPLYNRSLKEPTIYEITDCEYWYVDRLVGSDAVSVELSWNSALCSGVVNPADLLVARWDGSIWRDHGNGGTTGTVAAGTVVSSGAISSFSPFTLATATNLNPLPIELTSFDAELNNRTTNLEWTTATEWNNDYFEIEKSQDGVSWEAFHKEAGAGNSQIEQQYEAVDLNPFEGVTYYRLKQVDFDGSFTYSTIRTVNMNVSNIVVYPNPVQDYFVIQGLETGDTYQVLGNDGRLILSGNLAQISTVDWAAGVYFLVVYNNQNNLKEQLKIVK